MKQELRREWLNMLVLNPPGAADDGCLKRSSSFAIPSAVPSLQGWSDAWPAWRRCQRHQWVVRVVSGGSGSSLALLSTSLRNKSLLNDSQSHPASFLAEVAFAQPQPGRFSAWRSI